ncbi:unnamed protein product [Nezara viridula]|uniref:Uncharacterized protein n=1 Tax=Nezara viridula TaxID=85310 RepID=A0A9P0HD98_NEZVI|nr:unnamed protein product [Nezara viridula]
MASERRSYWCQERTAVDQVNVIPSHCHDIIAMTEIHHSPSTWRPTWLT